MVRLKRKPGRACCAGFSLLEMLVALAVLGVLLTVAAPSFRSMWSSVRMSAVTNDFLAALHLTRSSAIRLNRSVVMCVSGDAQSCDQNADWHAGWMVFVDLNNNGRRDGEDEQVLLTQSGVDSGIAITGNSAVNRFISWRSDGRMRRGTGRGVPQMGTVTFCPEYGQGRQIVVNIGGRMRVQTVSGGCGG